MHVDSDRTEQDWASELWPDDGPDPDWPDDGPDRGWPDDGADPEWPDDWPERGRPDVAHRPDGYGVPALDVGSRTRGRRLLALALTFVVALGAGAGAVYLYKSDQAGPASATASPSPRTTIGGPAGAGSVESVMVLGRVLAVGHDSVTVGGGPGQEITARATSATQFTGTVRSLAQVRVGDTVTAQITVSDGVARLVRLQDPASQS
jgi:hypothetical protein